MKARKAPTNIVRYLSCIFMMLALVWLTISLPLVYAAQQEIVKKAIASGLLQAAEEENENPLTNTTEEKSPRSGTSLSEEYIHDTHAAENPIAAQAMQYHVEHHPTYLAFYGDQDSPPPDLA